MKAIIIDDEKGGRDYLSDLVQNHCPELEIIGVADGLASGQKLLDEKQPDLLFLDIELPGGSGFRLLDQLEEIPFQVIFTTAYSEYASQAFRYAAIDYLLKPVVAEQLVEAVQRAKNQAGGASFKEKMEVWMSNSGGQKPKKVLLPRSRGFEMVEVEKILYCQADGNYTEVYLLDGHRIIVSKNLKMIEQSLPKDLFFRPHQSYLINLHCISRFSTGDDAEIELTNRKMIPIARSKRKLFTEVISSIT